MLGCGVISLRWSLGLLVSVTLLACGREPEQASAPPPRGSVWVVDAPQTGGRLYLCGTIHILREQDYPLAPGYEAAYRAAKRLVLELPPGAGQGGAMSERMRELGQFPAGTTLSGQLEPKLWQGVQAWSRERGLPAQSMDAFRPWFVSLIITATEYAALGARPEMGVDQHFENRARRDGKPAEGLETVEFQLQLFARLSDKLQREMLEQTLGEIGTIGAEYEKMIQAWKTGELDALHAMLFHEAEKFPELMELFLAARNRTWMKRLEQLLQQGDTAMILVGTGHFAADTGLLELLRQRGYRVAHFQDSRPAAP